MVAQLAIRALPTARLCLPSSTSTSQPSSSTSRASPKPQSRCVAVSFPTSSAISILSILSPAFEPKALALTKEQIVTSLTEVEKTIDQVQETGTSFLDTTQKLIDTFGKTLKPAVDAAAPIVQQAREQALNTASPLISEASKIAKEAFQGIGIDMEPVFAAAKRPKIISSNEELKKLVAFVTMVAGAAGQTTKVIEGAKPLASSTIETISSAEPVTIVATAGVSFVAYLLLPPIWSAISYSFRGYEGDLTPAQTLDLMLTKNYIMIDIRSEKDKNKAGVPRLPSAAKNKMIAIPLEDLPSKLRGMVRSTKKVEAEIAALKISYLKKINKGSNIVIMDSYSDSAKIVARTLTNLGFKNCWIVADGFSGGRGWLQSRLGTDSYTISIAEVLSPSRVIPAAARRFGTTTTTKLLPGSE